MEIISIGKIIFYICTGGIGLILSILGFLLRREFNRNNDIQKDLYEDISNLKKDQNNQKEITYKHETAIQVMNAEKVGRPELKEEMDKIQQGFEAKLKLFRDDIKEDIKELKNIVIESRRQ